MQRSCGLCVVYIQKYGATLLVGAWQREKLNKLNFNRNTKFSNLSSEERAALKNLSKRRDIIVKAADKGGALVVWQADLY